MYIYDTSVKIHTIDTLDTMSGTDEPASVNTEGGKTVGNMVVTSVRIGAKGQVELKKHIQ